MTICQLLLCLLGLTMACSATNSTVGMSPQEMGALQMRFIGKADGRSFFEDDSDWMTFREALAHCETFGMQLASITSQEQYDVLKESASLFRHWISGRDSLTLKQFVWHDNEEPVPDDLPFKPTETYLSCLTFYRETGKINNFLCDTSNYPLCAT